jgi:hypothetical protein
MIAVMLAIVCGWATVRWNIISGGSVAIVILLTAWLAFAASRGEAKRKARTSQTELLMHLENRLIYWTTTSSRPTGELFGGQLAVGVGFATPVYLRVCGEIVSTWTPR